MTQKQKEVARIRINHENWQDGYNNGCDDTRRKLTEETVDKQNDYKERIRRDLLGFFDLIVLLSETGGM